MIVSKVSAQSLELEWRPPLGDGGSPVVGYVVEMTETGGGGGGRWLKVGYVSARETRFTVAGLAEGASYFFRVSAENSSGLSRPLQSDCVTPSQPLGTPTTASQGGYIFHAGGSLAGAGYCRRCRRRPAILPLQLWQGCQGYVKISAQRIPRVAQFNAR